MLSELYVIYLINDHDPLNSKNGWVAGSSTFNGANIKVVRNDEEKNHFRIKSFYSKRAAYQYAQDVERCLQQYYQERVVTTQVQAKFLDVIPQI